MPNKSAAQEIRRINVRAGRFFRDRRKFERLEVPLRIDYKFRAPYIISSRVMCRNISGGGMRLQLPHCLDKGAAVSVFIHFPSDPKPVAAASEVVWCRRMAAGSDNFDIGLKYTKMSAEDKERYSFLFCETMIDHYLIGEGRANERRV